MAQGRVVSRLTEWRDAVRDAPELDKTAVLVAYTLSTYMNRNGEAWPSKETLAKGCRLGAGKRAVDKAVDRLEAAGFLMIQRSKGRSSNRYLATFPTAQTDARLKESIAHGSTSNVARIDSQRRKQMRTKAVESEEESVTPEELARREIKNRPGLDRWLTNNGSILADDAVSFRAELGDTFGYGRELADALRRVLLDRVAA